MNTVNVKGQLSSLKQFLKIESPLKMMKNAFYFMPKAKVHFKIYVTVWTANKYNKHITQYLKK